VFSSFSSPFFLFFSSSLFILHTRHYPLPTSHAISIIQPNPDLMLLAVGFTDGKLRVYDMSAPGRLPKYNATLDADSVAEVCWLNVAALATFCKDSRSLHLFKFCVNKNTTMTRGVVDFPSHINAVARLSEDALTIG
jgi:hypothetical protein